MSSVVCLDSPCTFGCTAALFPPQFSLPNLLSPFILLSSHTPPQCISSSFTSFLSPGQLSSPSPPLLPLLLSRVVSNFHCKSPPPLPSPYVPSSLPLLSSSLLSLAPCLPSVPIAAGGGREGRREGKANKSGFQSLDRGNLEASFPFPSPLIPTPLFPSLPLSFPLSHSIPSISAASSFFSLFPFPHGFFLFLLPLL